MFRKYEKTYRILVPQFDVKGKHFLSKDETKRLLGGKVTITEKMDGANAGIILTKDGWFRMQKRGSLVDQSEHEQFNFFKAWTQTNYEKILKVPARYRLYGELMRAVHTIQYDRLPDWFLVFAIWDHKKNEYVKWSVLEELCAEWGFSTVPLIGDNVYVDRDELVDYIPKTSNYGFEKAEGIVVWSYRQQMRGKLVIPEFIKRMDESDHWTHGPYRTNSVI